MRSFWPPVEAAQADYEALRAAVVGGAPLLGTAAVRFARAGLVALIAQPVAAPAFVARLGWAARPAWTPYADPRLDALAAGYELVLGVADVGLAEVEVAE